MIRKILITILLVFIFPILDCKLVRPSYNPLLYHPDFFKLKEPRVEPSKSDFLRYEIAEIKVYLPLNLLYNTNKIKIRGQVIKDNKPVYNTFQTNRINFKFSPRDACFIGRWSLPWKPELGRYETLIDIEYNNSKWEIKGHFFISAKKPPDTIKPPLCIFTLETDTEYSNIRFQHPDYKLGGWQGLVKWARFAGADTLMYLTGMTKAMFNPTPNKPFRQYNIDFALKLGEEAHRQGLKFGAWIGAYLPYGKTQPQVGCEFARNLVDGKMFWTLNFSLSDRKRLNDIIYLVKFLDSRPEVDYIGLDYMRTGGGGYELVDEFVKDLYLDTPPSFWAMSKEARIWWLTTQIGTKENLLYLWQWWRARKVALLFKTIKEESGTKKPMFVFTLSWECGHGHGQDILMLNDAGADFMLLMLYEATKDVFDGLMVSLSKYFDKGDANILIGNPVDEHLLDNKYKPYETRPEEWYDRTMIALKKIYDGRELEGIFMHDLDRMLSGRGGDYSPMEFIIVAGTAFSKIKAQYSLMPIEVKAIGFKTIGGMGLNVSIKNISNRTIDNIEVELLFTPSVNPLKIKKETIKLSPGEEKVVTLPFIIIGNRYRAVVGALAFWGDSIDDRAFTFLPLQIKKPPKEKKETE
ncbi:MAG: hypothetical protein ACUVWP_01250 [bacterium]